MGHLLAALRCLAQLSTRRGRSSRNHRGEEWGLSLARVRRHHASVASASQPLTRFRAWCPLSGSRRRRRLTPRYENPATMVHRHGVELQLVHQSSLDCRYLCAQKPARGQGEACRYRSHDPLIEQLNRLSAEHVRCGVVVCGVRTNGKEVVFSGESTFRRSAIDPTRTCGYSPRPMRSTNGSPHPPGVPLASTP